MDRILLGQLGANGDCLYATILARQIRHDFPDAHLTWAISTQARDVVRNNPHIDEVWEVEIADWASHGSMWSVFEREAFRRYKANEFDRLVLSQIWPNNFANYDGTVRTSILRAYGGPITVPIENVIALTGAEIDRVEAFARHAGLSRFGHRILFECSSKSGQSFVTPDIAQDIADAIYRRLPDACVVFNTHLPMHLRDRRSRHAGALTLRESAHLTHHCTLFMGCGSGGTVAATSSAARPLPNIQLLSHGTSVYASFAHDFEYFGIHDRDFIELTTSDAEAIARVVDEVCRHGIETVRQSRPYRIPVTFDHYLGLLETQLLSRHCVFDAARSLLVTTDRYGWSRDLVAFAERRILPQFALDPSWLFPESRRFADLFRATVAGATAEAIPQQGRHRPAAKARRANASALALAAPVHGLVHGAWAARPLSVIMPAASDLVSARRIARAQREAVDTLVQREHLAAGPDESERLFGSRFEVEILPASPPSAEGLASRSDPLAASPISDPEARKRALSALLRSIEGRGTGGPLLLVGEASDTEEASRLLGSAGTDCHRAEPDYGAGARGSARKPTRRPEPGSLYAWLSGDDADMAGVGACVLVGPGAFGEQIDVLADKAPGLPVLVARTDLGEAHWQPALDDEPAAWPRITIVMPSFNQVDFIEAAIRSVLDQDYPNLDFVVVDGGSTDGAVDVIERYRHRCSTVIVEPDRGQSHALNKGFGAATGDIMNWLCSDDLLEPGALHRVARAFLRHGTDIVAGGCLRIGATRSDVLGRHHTALPFGTNLRFDPLEILRYTDRWLKGEYFYQPEVFFTRALYERCGGYIDERLYFLMDYDLWLRMALAGATVRHIPHDLGCSRVHDAQKTRAGRDVAAASPILEHYHEIFSALEAASSSGGHPAGRATG